MKVACGVAGKRCWKQKTTKEKISEKNCGENPLRPYHERIKHCASTKVCPCLLLEIRVAQMSPYNTLQTAR